MELSKFERETLISTNDELDYYTIYSCQKKMWNRLERMNIEPYKIDKDSDGEIIAKYYRVPLNYVKISISKKRELTEEQKEALRERARMNFKK